LRCALGCLKDRTFVPLSQAGGVWHVFYYDVLVMLNVMG
jgi:hypothetical protein